MWYKSNYKKYFRGKNTVSIYDELGLPKLINAVGTYTVVGGSRMSEETLRDLCDAARSFNDRTCGRGYRISFCQYDVKLLY